jgi:hypothetical protein
MAEERNIGTARALDSASDEEATKAQLQRQMEEARESISNTVNEIKETVTNQYQQMKETVVETLDWREQFRKRPVAWSVGALSVGFLFGYGVAGMARGASEESSLEYSPYETGEREEESISGARYPAYEGRSARMAKSFASQPITGGTYAATSSSEEAAYRPSYSSGYSAQPEEEEPEGPSLFERFKETQAYDRLQNELSNLGNRFIEQLSKTGQEVVLPALFLKLKELIGVDLSGQSRAESSGRQVSSSPTSSSTGSQTGSQRSYSASPSTGTGSQGSQSSYESSSAGSGGSSYATSENQGYGVEARDREAYRQGQSPSDREDYGRGRDRGN